jgi:hypothetical protein
MGRTDALSKLSTQFRGNGMKLDAFTHRWRLEQAEEAYQLFDTQTTGKAVILPS